MGKTSLFNKFVKNYRKTYGTRLKYFAISPEFIKELFQKGLHRGYDVIENALPPDAEILNVALGWPLQIKFLVRSKEFDELLDNEEIPQMPTPNIQRI